MIRVLSSGPLEGRVEGPPSKSYTQRALIASSLAEGRSRIIRPSYSDDALILKDALSLFGIKITGHDVWVVEGIRSPLVPNDVINCGLSGATIRFLISFSSQTKPGYTVLTGGEGLRRRPMGPLLDTIAQLGGWAVSTKGDGTPPVVVKGGGLRGGEARISARLSSQFVSSLLLSSPVSKGDTRLLVEDLVSKPYVDMTLAVMKEFRAEVERVGYREFSVSVKGYEPSKFMVPGDFSSISFFVVGALMTAGRVEIDNIRMDLPQADSKIINIARAMGGKVELLDDELIVIGPESLSGGEFDLKDCPDLLPAVAILGLKSPVLIKGVAHARVKESDRLHALAQELRKLGAKVDEFEDGLSVRPGERPKEEVVLNGWGDHRIVMALTIACHSLGVKCSITDEKSVSKSYPDFFSDFSRLGGIIGEGLEGNGEEEV